MTQALGYAVCEEMCYDERGRARERDLTDYHIFRANEMPELETIFIETFEPTHPFGVKAVAEIPMDGVAPAVANAVLDACGVQIDENPVTPRESVAGAEKGNGLSLMARTYVIGHVNPDTNSIAAAVGYAWLLRERDGDEFVAARAGPTNPQTTWVLKRLGLEAPLLLTDASPRFETITRRLDTATPDSPLREAWVILNRTGGIAPIVSQVDDAPIGMITGLSLFNFFAKQVGPHPREQGNAPVRYPGPALQ